MVKPHAGNSYLGTVLVEYELLCLRSSVYAVSYLMGLRIRVYHSHANSTESCKYHMHPHVFQPLPLVVMREACARIN